MHVSVDCLFSGCFYFEGKPDFFFFFHPQDEVGSKVSLIEVSSGTATLSGVSVSE